MSGPLKIGSVTIDTLGQLKVGGSNVQKAYVGSNQVFPCASLPYSYVLTYDFDDGPGALFGTGSIQEACLTITQSVEVYSNSSTFSPGAALYYDSCGNLPIAAQPYTDTIYRYYYWNGNYVTFETDGYTIRTVSPCSGTTTTTTSACTSYTVVDTIDGETSTFTYQDCITSDTETVNISEDGGEVSVCARTGTINVTLGSATIINNGYC
jgi:hypothetical protein